MWWQIAFWILLVPLIIIEFIVFLRTKKFSWLLYGMAVFTYVVAVMYTIDVFSLRRNAVIIVLLASAALMVLIGRHMHAPEKSSKIRTYGAAALGTLLILVFFISVILGHVTQTINPVDSVAAADLIMDEKSPGYGEVTLLNIEAYNAFILPVPISNQHFQACLITDKSKQSLYMYAQAQDGYPEVAAQSQRTFAYVINPIYLQNETPQNILVYSQQDEYSRPWACDSGQPIATIPVR